MRIVNSNLAMQGSSYTATSVALRQSEQVLGTGYGLSDGQGNSTLVNTKGEAVNAKAETISGNTAQAAVVTDFDNRSDNLNRKSHLTKAAKDLFRAQAQASRASFGGSPLADSTIGIGSATGSGNSTRNLLETGKTSTNTVDRDYSSLPEKDRIRMMVLDVLMSRLIGCKTHFKATGFSAGFGGVSYNSSGQSINSGRLVRRTIQAATKQESQVSFNAQGTVQTADGRSINLNLNFSFSQSVEISTTISSEVELRMCDPLVINYSGTIPKFADNTMSFDIDCDGTSDNIHMLNGGSGYLALDKNGNGKIDDGNELFGPKTDNGYGELAAYDEDGNGWIDENDSVFNSLKIWISDGHGGMRLIALKDQKVGAIYLGSVETEAKLYSGNQQAARLKRTGLVLLENGESRVMQELDLRI